MSLAHTFAFLSQFAFKCTNYLCLTRLIFVLWRWNTLRYTHGDWGTPAMSVRQLCEQEVINEHKKKVSCVDANTLFFVYFSLRFKLLASPVWSVYYLLFYWIVLKLHSLWTIIRTSGQPEAVQNSHTPLKLSFLVKVNISGCCVKPPPPFPQPGLSVYQNASVASTADAA